MLLAETCGSKYPCDVSFLFPSKATEHFRKMGRRKSKRKPPPKKKITGDLDTQFTCPFCNHEKSCDVKMERTRNTGIISCTVCLEEFQTPITYLSEPVDVYSDWIDACESANQ
ncbi:transcription elongation factor 1 homolog [Hippocampus zosterae]|uniref:transcription elongation factor 1 homolog n=1 Tax=Hippocampus zosterae TaxID=109293 RepID=UPI00223CFBD0|nr:transcription elongation factor 1 homolog [Hippocampus zosterae]